MSLDIDVKQLRTVLIKFANMTYDEFRKKVYGGRDDYVSQGKYAWFQKDPTRAFLDLDEDTAQRLLG